MHVLNITQYYQEAAHQDHDLYASLSVNYNCGIFPAVPGDCSAQVTCTPVAL